MFAYVTIFQKAGQIQGVDELGYHKQGMCVLCVLAFCNTKYITSIGNLSACFFLFYRTDYLKHLSNLWGRGGRELLGEEENLRSLQRRFNVEVTFF